jgi:muconate cycloisomerase
MRRLSAVGNTDCFEDPVPTARLDWYRELRAAGIAPIALTLTYGPTMIEAIAHGACDYANIKGVPPDIRKAGDVCWAAGIPAWLGTGVDLGILEAMYLHVAAATKSATRPSDLFGRLIREHNLITDDFPVADGAVAVPAGPGLGVELNRTALDRYTTSRREITI